MRIYTDTAADLPKEYYSEANVYAFPLSVEIDGKTYKDVFEMDGVTLYEAIKNGAQPKTSQVSPDTFLSEFEELAKSGEEGLYISFTSGLSGTNSTANMIRNQLLETYPDLKLTIIDSNCASFGQGLVVKEAVRLRNEGKSFEEVVVALINAVKLVQKDVGNMKVVINGAGAAGIAILRILEIVLKGLVKVT